MSDCPLSLWRGEMAEIAGLLVMEEFGGCLVCINLKTGRVRVDDTEEMETTAEDKDDATAWVLIHLKALRMNVKPLEVRDMLWKT